jgi:fatty acid desaturase
MKGAPTDAKADPVLSAATQLVRDLFAPSPLRYWLDLFASLALGGAAFVLTPYAGWSSPLGAVAFAVSVLALYRASIFVHEIAHREERDLPGFRLVWDLVCGMPMLVPSFLYEQHRDHHVVHSYATRDDAEYFAFARRGRVIIVLFLAANLLVPALAYCRLLLLTPLGWLSPAAARFIQARASALAINPEFQAGPLSGNERQAFRAREALAFGYVAALTGLAGGGVLPAARVVQGYALIASVSLLNGLRILVAHKYAHSDAALSLREQVLDSHNFPSAPWLHALWAPLGLRFHALHHLFPRLPYHALAEAHRRLAAGLPRDAWYHTTEQSSLRAALAALWRSAAGHDVAATQARPRSGSRLQA